MKTSIPIIATASALLLTSACGIGLEANNGIDTANPYVDGLTIVDIEPNYGPVTGGTSVEITVAGLTGEAEVFFGTAKLDVLQLDANTLRVTTPNAGTAYAVDVMVRSADDEDVMTGGFTFSDTGPPPDTGDPPAGGTGLVGGFVELSRVQIACASCLGYPDEFSVQAGAAFHAPTSGSWTTTLPPQGQCALNPSSTPPVSAYTDLGQWAYLQSGSTNIPLQGQPSSTGAGTAYLADNLNVNDFVSNGSYQLDVPGGPFTINNALRAAEGYNSVGPTSLMYSGEAGAFSTQVSSAGQTFTWSPAGSGDGFVIDIGAYDYNTGAYLGKVVCHGADTGSMFFPLGDYMDPPLLLSVGLYRRKITTSVNPADGSTIEAISTAGFLSTAEMTY